MVRMVKLCNWLYFSREVRSTKTNLEDVIKEQEIGYVSKFFGQISVAAIGITSGELHLGDKIHIVGQTTDFKMAIESM